MHLCSEQLLIIGRENGYLFLLYWLSDTYDDDNVKVIIEKWKNREGIEGNVCTFLKSLLTYYMWECQDPLKKCVAILVTLILMKLLVDARIITRHVKYTFMIFICLLKICDYRYHGK